MASIEENLADILRALHRVNEELQIVRMNSTGVRDLRSTVEDIAKRVEAVETDVRNLADEVRAHAADEVRTLNAVADALKERRET